MTPTLATGSRAGFTLVELMVVVAIVGLLASVVVLAAPASGPSLTREAETLAARLVNAREEAIMTNRTLEARLDAEGYGFTVVTRGGRSPVEGRAFRDVRWHDGTAPADATARVRFDATGGAQPATVRLTRGGENVTVTVDSAGKVEIDARL